MASTMKMLAKSLDVVLAIRTFFLASSVAGIVLGTVPFLRRRYMDYGIRSESRSKGRSQPPEAAASALWRRVLDPALTLKVPHRWFIHYYLVSTISACVWGYQLRTHGWMVRMLSSLQTDDYLLTGMSSDQVWLCWSLMLVQGFRRLLESLLYTKPSGATMPIAIYLIGILFYLVANVAVWVEGLDAILQGAAGVTAEVHVHSSRFFPLMVFTIASILQFACHRHLASLRKYSLPTNFLFRYVICPHYLMECIIYLSLARIAAPADRLFNATLLCAAAFVAINLSVVADSTREWWRSKFGEAAVRERYRMFPLIW